ncbi:MAG TPA: hypothetical protein VMV60_06350 [Thermoanaerobaculia bacterium]|nr:hypothetical protein [Thermoanaerobaculia bacterium]
MKYKLLAAALGLAVFDANGQDMMPTPPPTPPATISPAPTRTPLAPPVRKGKKDPPRSLDPVATPTPTPGAAAPTPRQG